MYCKKHHEPHVYPTKYCEDHHYSKSVVPHIHPQHTKKIDHHKYEHVHYYPHTYSHHKDVSHEHYHCGKPCKGYEKKSDYGHCY